MRFEEWRRSDCRIQKVRRQKIELRGIAADDIPDINGGLHSARGLSTAFDMAHIVKSTALFKGMQSMKAICYHNMKITLPYWAPNSRLNEECPLGFAYEDGDFYVHMYGRKTASI